MKCVNRLRELPAAGPGSPPWIIPPQCHPCGVPAPRFAVSPGVPAPQQRGHVTSSRCLEPWGSRSDSLFLCRPQRRTSWLGLAWSPSAWSSLFTTPSGSSCWYEAPLANIIPVTPYSGVSLAFAQAMMCLCAHRTLAFWVKNFRADLPLCAGTVLVPPGWSWPCLGKTKP